MFRSDENMVDETHLVNRFCKPALGSILLDPLWNVDAGRRKIPGLKTDGPCCECRAVMLAFTRKPRLPSSRRNDPPFADH